MLRNYNGGGDDSDFHRPFILIPHIYIRIGQIFQDPEDIRQVLWYRSSAVRGSDLFFTKEMASSFLLLLWVQFSVETLPAWMKVIALGPVTKALDKKVLGL